MKVICSFKTLEISNPDTQINNPEDLNPQQELGWGVHPEAGCEKPLILSLSTKNQKVFSKDSTVTTLVSADKYGPSLSSSQPLEPEERPKMCTVTHYLFTFLTTWG